MNRIKLNFGLVDRVIFGGPYKDKPADWIGIKCAREVVGKYDMLVPIRDFSVPDRPEHLLHALRFTLDRLAEGMPLYVGCMGGKGRTGLYLAILAKCLGHTLPVQFVRACFDPDAVETKEQEKYVEAFDVSVLRREIRAAKWKAFWFTLRGVFGFRPVYAS